MTPTRSTAELIAACGKADRSAWDVIVERYTPLMWSIARAHRLSLADCEDVVQTTWLQIVHHLDKVHTPERLGEWIGTATRREALKHIQTQKKHVPVGDGATLDRPERLDSSPEEAILDRERDSAYLAVHQYVGMPYEPYFRAFEQVARDLGGRPHWGKLHWRTAEDLREVYPRFDDFRAVRDRLDPGRVFANAYTRQLFGK